MAEGAGARLRTPKLQGFCQFLGEGAMRLLRLRPPPSSSPTAYGASLLLLRLLRRLLRAIDLLSAHNRSFAPDRLRRVGAQDAIL